MEDELIHKFRVPAKWPEIAVFEDSKIVNFNYPKALNFDAFALAHIFVSAEMASESGTRVEDSSRSDEREARVLEMMNKILTKQI